MDLKSIVDSIISESPAQPRARDEIAFKNLHLAQLDHYVDKDTADFFDSLRSLGNIKPFSRLADNSYEKASYEYDNLSRYERPIGRSEDNTTRVSLIKNPPVPGTVNSTFSMVQVDNTTGVVSSRIMANVPSTADHLFILDAASKHTGIKYEPLDTDPYRGMGNDPYEAQRNIKRLKIHEAAGAYEDGEVVKLKDGKTKKLNKSDAALLTSLFKDLNPGNKKKMLAVFIEDEVGFNEILSFAREADEE